MNTDLDEVGFFGGCVSNKGNRILKMGKGKTDALYHVVGEFYHKVGIEPVIQSNSKVLVSHVLVQEVTMLGFGPIHEIIARTIIR